MKTYTQFIREAIYKGNLGVIETARFHMDPNVPPEKKRQHLELVKQKRMKEAMEMIEDYIGHRFHPSMFNNTAQSSQ